MRTAQTHLKSRRGAESGREDLGASICLTSTAAEDWAGRSRIEDTSRCESIVTDGGIVEGEVGALSSADSGYEVLRTRGPEAGVMLC